MNVRGYNTRPVKSGNSFLQHHKELSKEWDYAKNIGGPADYSRGSGYMAWWTCTAGHSYQMALYNRARGCGCPFCAGNRKGFEKATQKAKKIVKEKKI